MDMTIHTRRCVCGYMDTPCGQVTLLTCVATNPNNLQDLITPQETKNCVCSLSSLDPVPPCATSNYLVFHVSSIPIQIPSCM
jgi:hypothetical protein